MWRSPIKRLDVYVLRNFLGLFLLTLMVCIFILLMQFVWMHVRDLVGKGAREENWYRRIAEALNDRYPENVIAYGP